MIPSVGDLVTDNETKSGVTFVVVGTFWTGMLYGGNPVAFLVPEEQLEHYLDFMGSRPVLGAPDCVNVLMHLPEELADLNVVLLHKASPLSRKGVLDIGLSGEREAALKGDFALKKNRLEVAYDGHSYFVDGHYLARKDGVRLVMLALVRTDKPYEIELCKTVELGVMMKTRPETTGQHKPVRTVEEIKPQP
ncbi:MAG: hypothetical protein PHY92_01270 [Alphaproteobacteria bacterium]|nr:hypothetical protein [Alphaproteobacteria bacterium]